MGKSIFKEQAHVLAVKESDLRFHFRGNYLKHVSISSNKVIEMRKNNLLEQRKLQEYTAIGIVHDKKVLTLPIVKGSWKYGGQNQSLLRTAISPSVRLKKGELHKWHLQLFDN